jgi:hypothetical protein
MADPKSTPPAAQEAEAERAREVKFRSSPAQNPSAGQTPNDGMNPIPNSEFAPSGAFDAEGQRPVLERSRKVR